MKIKKFLLIIIVTLSFLLLFSVKSEATLDLNELDFNAQINEDGSMDVIETWNIYISETNTLFKTFKMDSSKYSEINNVTVSEIIDGKNIEFSQIDTEMYHVTKDCYYALENSEGMFEIAWGVGLDDDSDTRVYQISYTVRDVIAKYNDYAEIYWQFVGDNFEISAKKINGTINLPQNAESEEDILVWGHTHDLNGEIFVTDLNKIEFTIKNYSGGNYVEVRSLFPLDMITSSGRQYDYNILDTVLQEETKWAQEANARRELKKNIGNIFAIIAMVITLLFGMNIFKNIRKLITMEKKFTPSTILKYFRELPYEDATPAEALFVLSSGFNDSFSSSFSANILDLCLKKYITLEVIEDGEVIKSDVVKITFENNKSEEELKADEKLTLDFLREVAGENNELTTRDITKYLEKHPSKVQKLNDKLETILETQETKNGNFIEDNYKAKNRYSITCIAYILFACFAIPVFLGLYGATPSLFLLVAILILLATLIINAVMTAIISANINVLSQKGVDEKEKWKAFKKYMEDFSLLKDKEVPALAVWEKYLVFATAFGISEKVLKQIKVIYPEITNMNSTINTYSYIYIMNSVNIGNCINSSVYSAIGSSGSGAGGGFSSGGGGGRWPEVAVADAKNMILYIKITD